jgi:hypothetical protein
MGYVLRNGKRYYQDENGHLSLDNVSQNEADRRERRNSNSSSSPAKPYSGTSHNPVLGGGASIMPDHRSVPWGIIIVSVIVLMLVGAFLYNQHHVSSAEQAISEYMDNVTGINREDHMDDAEQMTEYADALLTTENEMVEMCQ